jgi:hypothetical protein
MAAVAQLKQEHLNGCIICREKQGNRFQRTQYNCGYSIIKESGVIMVRDDVEKINRYELYERNIECTYLFMIVYGVIRNCAFSAEEKRWFIEELDKIELKIPGFVSDSTGELLAEAISTIFAKKNRISIEDYRLYKYCKSLISGVYNKHPQYDIEAKIKTKVEVY